MDIPRQIKPSWKQRSALGGVALALLLFTIGPAYKHSTDGSEALRVKVRLGRGSVAAIEIMDGLAAGDQVILSETSAWDTSDRIRLK